MDKRLLFLGGIAILLFFNACKTMKTTGSSVKSLSTKKIVREHYKAEFSKNTLQTKIKALYKDSNSSYNLSIKLRIKKDEIIWMSGSFLGFPVAKVKITPTRVQYYEKIKRTYFDGDFSIISKALGTELNFQQLQNLLTGQSLLAIDGKHDRVIDNKSYRVTPKDQEELFEIFYWINPIHFKLDKQRLNNTKAKQSLIVEYDDYQKNAGEYLPKVISINAIEPKKTTHIKMDLRNIEFDKELRFPFSIPTNYRKISIKSL